jgi:excinuclease UvrABC ATPase subunit
VRINGEIKDITPGMKLDRYKTHDIEIVIDRMLVEDTAEERKTTFRKHPNRDVSRRKYLDDFRARKQEVRFSVEI